MFHEVIAIIKVKEGRVTISTGTVDFPSGTMSRTHSISKKAKPHI